MDPCPSQEVVVRLRLVFALLLALSSSARSKSFESCSWPDWKKGLPVSLTLDSAPYVVGGLGGVFLVNNDVSTFFDRGPGFNKDNLGTYFQSFSSLGLGLSTPLLGFETGWDFGPARKLSEHYSDGGGVNLSWNSQSWYVMPMLHHGWYGPKDKMAHLDSLGLKWGWPVLTGRVDTIDGTGAAGSYDQNSRTTLFALVFRSDYFLSRRASMAFEWGYQWAKFNLVDNSAGSGKPLGGVASPANNLNGGILSVDDSGWYLKLTLSGWMRAPYEEPAEGSTDKAAKDEGKEKEPEGKGDKEEKGEDGGGKI
jgi:hypothetical protein